MTVVTFQGDLFAAEEFGQHDPLIEAILDVRAGNGNPDGISRLFRDTTVWVETEPDGAGGHAVRSAQIETLRWLPAFTSLAELGLFAQASGRGDQEIHYGQLCGAEILDGCLPVLPRGTGVLVNPASEHVFALPPISGIVSDSLAVDRDSGVER